MPILPRSHVRGVGPSAFEKPPLWLSLVIGAALGVVFWWWTVERLAAYPPMRALDFTYAWRAAGHLLAGRNPYEAMPPAPYAEGGLFLYPLPTAIVTIPFARLSIPAAGALFMGISAGVCAFALSRGGLWRLLPLLSPPWLYAYLNIQWAPLMLASAVLPAIGWLGVVKPNLGIVAFAYRPRWSTAIGATLLIVASLLWIPQWPMDWLAAIRQQEAPHDPPLLWPFGFIGLLGLLRWRTGEGRALTAATVAPAMSLPYDHLLLWLVARNWKESAVLLATGWAAWTAALVTSPHDLKRTPEFVQGLLAVGLYWPATIIVLRRRNDGSVPAWLERLTSRWPRWLRGEAPAV
jgi:hypothetical protein